MKKRNKIKVPYEQATGELSYGLTNDYMFRALFQTSELARKGLIASVLHMNPNQIQSVDIRNPIKLGEKIEDKEFVLDIEVLLNNNHIINLEMQMTYQLNWQDRSLSYLCRSFDQLYKGDDYSEAKPATHIGFLNFTPFPDNHEFNACYMLLNLKNHHIYSDKLSLHMVDLTHIELATEEDKAWKIDYWARLFTAKTWEEIKMITENNIHMEAAAKEMYVQRCRARDDFRKLENSRNRIMKQLTEALEVQKQEIENKDKEIEVKDRVLESQKQEIELLKQQLAALSKNQ